jgi:hypothetical protein
MPLSPGNSNHGTGSEAASTIDLHVKVRAVEEAVLDVLWRQWAVVGAGAAANTLTQSIVDPEALIMASLWFFDQEPRLRDLLASWLVANVSLLSVQRLKNVAALFPARARSRVPAVARLAVERGKDSRWKPLVKENVSALLERPGKTLSIGAPLERLPALMLRLRALLGVGMRADIITYLISAGKGFGTADDIAEATAYNATAVRRLVTQLSKAGGLKGDENSAHTQYTIKGSALGRLSDPRPAGSPTWRYTAQMFALTTEFLEWGHATKGRIVSEFAMRVKDDELYRRFRPIAARMMSHRLPSKLRRGSSGDFLWWLAAWLYATK